MEPEEDWKGRLRRRAVGVLTRLLELLAREHDAVSLLNGQLLRIYGSWYRVNGLDPASRQISLVAVGEASPVRGPWRVLDIKAKPTDEWQPGIMDARGKVIAVVYGRDAQARLAHAQAFVLGLEQAAKAEAVAA